MSKTPDNKQIIFTSSTGTNVYLTPTDGDSDIVLTQGDQIINGTKTFSSSAVFSSTGYFTNGLISSASGSFSGLHVSGDISATNVNVSGNISFSNLALPGYLSVASTGYFNGPLVVNGTGYFNGVSVFSKAGVGLEVTNSATVGGALSVSSTGSFLGVNVSQSGSFGGVYCHSTGTFMGTVLANCNTGTSLYVASISNTDDIGDGALVVVGGTSIAKDVRVGGRAFKPSSQFWTISSDKRIKENITDLSEEDSIASLKAIKVKTYDIIESYREKYNLPKNRHIGVLADDLFVTHPQSIKITKESFGGVEIDDFKTVDMSSQLFELIVCCQNMLKRIEMIEKKLDL